MENEKMIVLDTETTNSLDDPFCYDIGFAVVDRTGKVYETHSYVVADIFLDKELMAVAYFKEKIPQYWEDIKSGKRILRRLKTIRFILKDIMMQYNIKKVYAHNARFDYRSLNYTQRLTTCSKYRYFLPYGTEIFDILKMARKILGKDPCYTAFCEVNGYKTQNGANRYTAEIIYRYLTGENNFEEVHCGLDDVMIEKEIMAYCYAVNGEVEGKLW